MSELSKSNIYINTLQIIFTLGDTTYTFFIDTKKFEWMYTCVIILLTFLVGILSYYSTKLVRRFLVKFKISQYRKRIFLKLRGGWDNFVSCIVEEYFPESEKVLYLLNKDHPLIKKVLNTIASAGAISFYRLCSGKIISFIDIKIFAFVLSQELLTLRIQVPYFGLILQNNHVELLSLVLQFSSIPVAVIIGIIAGLRARSVVTLFKWLTILVGSIISLAESIKLLPAKLVIRWFLHGKNLVSSYVPKIAPSELNPQKRLRATVVNSEDLGEVFVGTLPPNSVINTDYRCYKQVGDQFPGKMPVTLGDIDNQGNVWSPMSLIQRGQQRLNKIKNQVGSLKKFTNTDIPDTLSDHIDIDFYTDEDVFTY